MDESGDAVFKFEWQEEDDDRVSSKLLGYAVEKIVRHRPEKCAQLFNGAGVENLVTCLG
jgi:hypothetical protein